MSMAPEDWTYWLTIATAVHNNQKNETTGLSPNQILLGHKPKIGPLEQVPSKNETANDQISIMMER